MDGNLHSKMRELTRQPFINPGEVVGLFQEEEGDFEGEFFEGEDQEDLGLADTIWADSSQTKMNAAITVDNLVTLRGNAWLVK